MLCIGFYTLAAVPLAAASSGVQQEGPQGVHTYRVSLALRMEIILPKKLPQKCKIGRNSTWEKFCICHVITMVLCCIFVGRDSAHLDETSFTQKLLVRRGSRAQFDCRFSNSILTEWYKGENKRLNNVPNK